MSVRIMVDEALPAEVAELLSAHGHDALKVAAQGWTGMTDAALWPRVQEERRWLITADKGFANLRHHPPGSHAGGILLRATKKAAELIWISRPSCLSALLSMSCRALSWWW